MATIDTSSFINSSIVSDVVATIRIGVNSVINTNVIPSISPRLSVFPNSVVNPTQSIGGVGIYHVIRLSSFVETNTVGPITILPDSIGLIEIKNQSKFGDVYVYDVDTPIALEPFNVTNQNAIGKVVVFTQTLVQENILPITRPRTTVTNATTGLKKFVFRDLAMKGGSHPLTGDILTVTDQHAIGQAIRNIVMTIPTERFFDFIDFGVGIERYLFAVHDLGMKDRITDDILSQVALYEPRAIINSVETSGEAYLNQLEIDITYTVKTTNVTSTITILLERR